MRHSILSVPLIALLSALPASGAVLFETTTVDPAGERVRAGTVTVDDERVRIDQDDDQSFLFGDGEMVVVNHSEQWALPLDREAIASLGQQMSAMKEQMEAALAQVPEEQRGAYRQMLEQQMGGAASAPAEPIELEPGEGSEVEGFACRVWTARRSETIVQELCVAEPGDVEGAPAALAAIRSMAEAFEDVIASLRNAFPGAAEHPALQGNPFAQLNRVDGFPIRVTAFENGQPGETTRILPAGTTTVEPGFFDHRPEGYEIRSLSGR